MGWILIIATMILGAIGQFAVSSAYKKWGNVASAVNLTGADLAIQMLAEKGQQDVQVNVVPGTLTDYFDPATKTLNLSQDVAYGKTVAAHAVACHEAGHYLQFCEGYTMMKVRHALVPIANFASQATWIVLMIGLLLQMVNLIYLAAACYGVALLFSIVTLPVEFNASKRAIAFLDGQNGVICGVQVPNEEREGTRSMLRAAASTYVFSTIASLLNLLYILAIARN